MWLGIGTAPAQPRRPPSRLSGVGASSGVYGVLTVGGVGYSQSAPGGCRLRQVECRRVCNGSNGTLAGLRVVEAESGGGVHGQSRGSAGGSKNGAACQESRKEEIGRGDWRGVRHRRRVVLAGPCRGKLQQIHDGSPDSVWAGRTSASPSRLTPAGPCQKVVGQLAHWNHARRHCRAPTLDLSEWVVSG